MHMISNERPSMVPLSHYIQFSQALFQRSKIRAILGVEFAFDLIVKGRELGGLGHNMW